ncbi:MAG TPA: hypothetical protein VEV15_10870 [Flavisolibacter sp.]|nr:hypothetical protein [Flavisolibacter sp.]
MDQQELPDLSDWQFVEVWTIEEAALLWAAVNPIEYMGARLKHLKQVLSPEQYSKACIYERAIAEAVCGGTLPFVTAWEERQDYQNSYEKEVEFPDLPNPSYVITSMTRITQAAFIKWAAGKKMLSVKQQRKLQQRREVFDADTIIEMQVSEKPLAIAAPIYLDPAHPLSPAELRAAHEAWVAVTQDGNPKNSGTAIRAAVMKFLDSHPTHSALGAAAKERICTVANWDKKGGATKTPTKK